LFAGDTSYRPWEDKIIPYYAEEKIKSSLLLASHHGSDSFFERTKDYYTSHLRKIKPDMTFISVGDNSYGLPDKKAIELYTKYSNGSDKGNKLFRTDTHGNISFKLKGNGSWNVNHDQA